MKHIILAVLIILATAVWLWVTNWVTFTDEEIQLLEDRMYTWPIFIWDERINELVRYQYTHCVERIGTGHIRIKGRNYSCLNQTFSRTAENWARWWRVKSPTNDHWICQLNYRRHKTFIDKPEFKDPYNQIHYCQEVWEDAMKKWSMPRVAYWNISNVKHRFEF